MFALRSIFLFCIGMLTSACVTAQTPTRLDSVHTGLMGVTSGRVQVSRHMHFHIYAEAMVIRSTQQVAHAVYLTHPTHAGETVFVDEVWSAGERLHFFEDFADLTCQGLVCARNMGTLVFSEAEFSERAQTGIVAQMITSAGPIMIEVPAHVFEAALALAPP